ncbi:unnamed protein product [Brassica napus]|uniref:(rape) hypothetical protein n=1 Tax=Brassica napus TaxID=3708 RepID=A0A816JTV8_BRANA|nr:unnamed protein product [Brassica napus]
MNNSEKEVKTEADSSSSDHPCPLALVTASNVRKATQCRERRPPTSPSQKQFMKLKLAHDSLIRGRQYLSVPFMRANGMTKPGLITLVGKDGVKWKVNLKEEGSGSALCLGTGWKEFAKANGLKTGDYFTLESAWKNEIPMLSLVNTESASDRKERGESSKAMEKERSTDTSSIVQNRVVTLALETKDVKACTLNLPSEFVTAIGIKKLGKITFLGKDGMKWWGCLLSGNGSVAVGIGWRNFCEANGVKLGESFSLVLINEEEDTEKLTERWVWFCVCMLLQTIPVAFLKYIEGTNGHHSAKLRSDASKITWEVKIEDGRRLTNGWKEFALAHDLRIGDILIFRQEKDMAFHVTLLGPSGCEIQYESCSEEENNIEKTVSPFLVDPTPPFPLKTLIASRVEGALTSRDVNMEPKNKFFRQNRKINFLIETKTEFSHRNRKIEFSHQNRKTEFSRQNKNEFSRRNRKTEFSRQNRKIEFFRQNKNEFSRRNRKTEFFRQKRKIEFSRQKRKIEFSRQNRKTDKNRKTEFFRQKFAKRLFPPKSKTGFPPKLTNFPAKTVKTSFFRQNCKNETYENSTENMDQPNQTWRIVCEANGLKLGKSFTLEIINEHDKAAPVFNWVITLFSPRIEVYSSRDSELLKFMRMPNKRFFKPLLPGFHSHLTIPVAFFLKYIEGTNEHHTAKLRSDASKITWEVKIEDGQKLTDGWKEFAIAHDLRIGDILMFRQEKDMAFHVTLLGPSGCEFQYESCSEEENNLGENIPKKKNLEREAESSSLDPSCFLATIWPSSLRYDTLNLPRSFVRSNGLETRCGGEIVLMNEKGKSWTLALKQKLSGSTYIRRGWRRFCSANVLKTGGVYTFKLIHSGRTPVLRLFFTESESESEERNVEKIQRKKAESSSLDPSSFVANNPTSTWKASSSQSQNRFLTLALKPFNLEKYILYFPVRFSRSHGINEEAKMTLLDKNGVKWSTDLRSEETSDRIRLVGGWQEFFKTNCMKPGESIIVKLIWEGDKSCVLKFCSKVKNETK